MVKIFIISLMTFYSLFAQAASLAQVLLRVLRPIMLLENLKLPLFTPPFFAPLLFVTFY